MDEQKFLTERFEAARALEWFRDFQPTLFFGVPTVYVRLLELPADEARAIGARHAGLAMTRPSIGSALLLAAAMFSAASNPDSSCTRAAAVLPCLTSPSRYAMRSSLRLKSFSGICPSSRRPAPTGIVRGGTSEGNHIL
jgi:hypothetical protein